MKDPLNKKLFSIVLASLAATAVLSLYSIWRRHQVESRNLAVAVSAEYEVLESLAGAQGITLDSAFADLKAQGLNAIVLNEQTLGDLISGGQAQIVARKGEAGKGPELALRFLDTDAIPRVRRGLRIQFGNLAGDLTLRGDTLMLPPVSAITVRSTAIGLNPEQVASALANNLEIIARFSNPNGATDESVEQTLQWANQMGARIYLPQGDEVLGRRNSVDTTVATLKELGMWYASPEFAKIAGDEEMVKAAPDIVVRLHSAQIADLDKLTRIEAVDRYVKAARERNMRALLLRPFSFAGARPLSDFAEFMRDITRELLKNGQKLDSPHPYTPPAGLPKPFFVLLGFAIAPTVWVAVARFVPSHKARVAGAVLLGLLALACVKTLGAEAMALLGSMSFPILAFFTLDQVLPKLKGGEMTRIVSGFWIVSAISLVGGLCVAGMLNGLPFYVRASEFQAVKLSVFLPILVVGAHYFLTLSNWKGALKSPITWGASATAVVIGAVLAVMLARTGNDTGAGPSGGEMLFRNLLDRFLFVRPRTKEFLVGHPMLIVGIGILLRLKGLRAASEDEEAGGSWAGWTVLLLMLGAIGQTSVVNTMCHLHIPVVLSLARIVEGLVLGCIIGVGVWAAVGRLRIGKEA